MDEGEHWELFETVARRHDFLALLSEEPLDKASIVRQLDVSRSTVNRAISTLNSYGLVERTDSRYRTTAFGEAVSRHFQQTLSTVDRLVEARPLLERISDLAPPLMLFRDSTVITNEHDRHAPVRFLIRLLTDATVVRSTGGIFRNSFPTSISKRLKSDERFRMHLVFSRRTYDWAQAYHEPDVCRIIASDRHALRLVNSHRPTTVVILERDTEPQSSANADADTEAAERVEVAVDDERTHGSAAVVVFYDDRDEPAGLVYATDPCTVAWATRHIERTWDEGTQPPLCDAA